MGGGFLYWSLFLLQRSFPDEDRRHTFLWVDRQMFRIPLGLWQFIKVAVVSSLPRPMVWTLAWVVWVSSTQCAETSCWLDRELLVTTKLHIQHCNVLIPFVILIYRHLHGRDCWLLPSSVANMVPPDTRELGLGGIFSNGAHISPLRGNKGQQ